MASKYYGLMFIPKIGELIQFDVHIFSDGLNMGGSTTNFPICFFAIRKNGLWEVFQMGGDSIPKQAYCRSFLFNECFFSGKLYKSLERWVHKLNKQGLTL